MRDPNTCENMGQLRTQINQIDRALVDLLTQRMSHIDRAIELKQGQGLPARIDARVEDVLDRVNAEARLRGLDPNLTRKIWTQLIEWSIAREEQVLDPAKDTKP